MAATRQDTRRIEAELKGCQEVLTALGDETRQHIICAMLQAERPGLRAAEVAQRANISRPTASHHLQILKRAGIVCARKDGSRIRYYLDPDQRSIRRLCELTRDIQAVTSATRASEAAAPASTTAATRASAATSAAATRASEAAAPAARAPAATSAAATRTQAAAPPPHPSRKDVP